jgi:hypothetical protein
MPTPPCRVCQKAEPIIVYPDDHALAICPDCCDKADHPDEEKGHQWEHDRWEGWLCRYCGIQRKCTNYEEGSYLD